MYIPNDNRYENMTYNRVGDSGLLLPAISLGFWWNFGENNSHKTQKEMCHTAFDLGITHFDLANNYGPPAGEAERNLGRILRDDFSSHRDELIISSKAGHKMWDGPYGDFGSKKYLTASLDQSLKRLDLDYVDIFYHHRPDPDTNMEESLTTLDLMVKQGKALYVGISQYSAEDTKKAIEIFKKLGTPFIIHQPNYNIFSRWIEDGLTDVLRKSNLGSIVFSPLAMGQLTDKYLGGVMKGSRLDMFNMKIDEKRLSQIHTLNDLAKKRGQTLAQMALSWALRLDEVTSVLIGASNKDQISENVKALDNLKFTKEELDIIDNI